MSNSREELTTSYSLFIETCLVNVSSSKAFYFSRPNTPGGEKVPVIVGFVFVPPHNCHFFVSRFFTIHLSEHTPTHSPQK